MSEKILFSGNDFYFQQAENIAGSSSKTHYHNRVEVYYMLDGACNYFIGAKSYKVTRGNLVLIPEGVIHRTNYTSKLHSRWLINCSESYVPESVAQKLGKMPNVFTDEKVVQKAYEIMKCVAEEYAKNDSYSEDMLRHLTGELFILLARNSSAQTVSQGTPFIEKTVKYIQENFASEITLNETAKLCSVSPEHLSRTFKKETGFGFSEYLTLVRLKRAEDMLKNEPGKSVNEVAFSCGFNDSNYFSYKFKNAYGKAPSRAKKR